MESVPEAAGKSSAITTMSLHGYAARPNSGFKDFKRDFRGLRKAQMLDEVGDKREMEGDTVGKLMTKIRQKLCRHTRFEFSAWHHEDGKWFIYGTCIY